MTAPASTGNPTPAPTLLLLTGDLFLGTRLRGLAESAGYSVRAGVSTHALDTQPGELPDRVIVDLATPRLDIDDLCRRFSPDAASSIAAYAPHVRVDLLRAARAAGLSAVFARSQLDAELPLWLANR